MGRSLHGKSRMRRVDIRAILAEPEKRRELLIRALMALQAREGIETSREQAENAIDRIKARKP
jgi:hypothetical protein